MKRLIALALSLLAVPVIAQTPYVPEVSVSGAIQKLPAGGTIVISGLATGAAKCVQADASGNLTVAGSACATGGSGTVTSVAASGGTTGLSFTGSPITTTGTLTLGGTLGIANGGTGATTAAAARTALGAGTGNGTVTSVALSGGTTGLTVSGSPITTSGTITLAGTLAVANGGTGATTAAAARTALGLAIGTNVQAWDADLDAISALTGTSGLLRKTAANAWSLDTSTYLTANQTITLTGDASGSGTTSIPVTLATVPIAKGGTGATTAAGAQTNLGLGTAATQNTGTSGATVPLLNGVNTWSGNQSITGTSAPQLTMSNSTQPLISFNAVGSGPPTFTTRSVGTKIAIYPALTGTTGDYALGIDSSTLWSSVPATSNFFVWYGGTTQAMSLSGTGNLNVVASVNTPSITLSGLTGYVKANGSSAATASASVAGSDVSGNITGNAANVTGTVAIANGGTGATTAAAARTALGAGTGNGSVTSVAVSGGTTGLTTSGGPVTTSGTITLAGTLAVANGGTGSITAAARTALGLGTIATQNSNAVAITGGTATGLTGPLTFTGAAGISQLDASGNTVTLAASGTVSFTNMSGMLLVNSNTSGLETLYLFGGGLTAVAANVQTQVGTLTFNSGTSSYVFTNNSGASATYTMYVFKMRNAN